MTRLYALAASLLFLSQATVTFAGLVQAEYFVGADPGLGQGTPINVTADTNATAADLSQVSIPLAGLAPGTHNVNVRVKDSAGRWSSPFVRRFTLVSSNFTVPTPALSLTTNNLAAAELFIGSDPGAGAGTAIALTNSGFAADAATIQPISNTTLPGTYQVGLRFKDAVGRWSTPMLRRVTIQPSSAVTATIDALPAGNSIPPQPASAQSYGLSLAGPLVCGEVFTISIGGYSRELQARPFESAGSFLERLALTINEDPRLGSMVEATAVAGQSVIVHTKTPGRLEADWVATSANLPASLLTEGTLGEEGRKIVEAEYFVGLEPAPGQGTPVTLVGSNSNAASFATELSFPTTGLRDGPHPVGLRFKNAAGHWGQPVIKGFTSYSPLGEQDRTAPSLLLQGLNPLEVPFGTGFTEPGFTATDDIDGDLSTRVMVAGAVDTSIPGEYTLQYRVADTAGNKALAERTVIVTDAGEPAFQGDTDISYTAPPATIDLFAGLRAIDPQLGDISHRIKLVSSDVNWFAAGTYTAAFEVEDSSGNKAYLSRSIALADEATFYPGFQTWIDGHGSLAQATEAEQQPSADPDGDGQSNEQEWRADTDPFSRWSVFKMEYAPSQTQEIMRWSALGRTAYLLEASEDLVTWTAYGEEIAPQDSCLVEYEFARDQMKQTLFYRLRAYPRKPLLELP